MVFFALLVWIVLSLLVAIVATKKGRSFIAFLLLALITSPLISAIILLVLGDDNATVTQRDVKKGISKKCPQCAETVKVEAKICRYCNYEFPEVLTENGASASTLSQETTSIEEDPVRTRSDLEPSFSDLVQKIDKGVVAIFAGFIVVMASLYASQESAIKSAGDSDIYFNNYPSLLETNFSKLSLDDQKLVKLYQAPNPESWPIEKVFKTAKFMTLDFAFLVSLTIPTEKNPKLKVNFIENNYRGDDSSKYFSTISLTHPDGTERQYTVIKSLWENTDILDLLLENNGGNLHSVYDHLTKISDSYRKFWKVQNKRSRDIYLTFRHKFIDDKNSINSRFKSYYIYALIIFSLILTSRILLIIFRKSS